MSDTDERDERGMWIGDDGAIRYAWPPEGRFADIWDRCKTTFTEQERWHLSSLLNHWMDDNSRCVSRCYQDEETGEWVWEDVAQPDWSMPEGWGDQ